MASKEEIQKNLIQQANVSLGEQLNLVGQIQDKMSFLLKTQQDVFTQDRQSLSLVKEAYAITKQMTSEYTSSKDVQKDIAKNQKLQNQIARQQLNLEKEVGAEGKKRIQFIANQAKGLDESRKKLAELRAAEDAGVVTAKAQADELSKQIFYRQQSLVTQQQNLSNEEKQLQLLQQTTSVLQSNAEILEEEAERTKVLEDAQSGLVKNMGRLGKVLDKIGFSKTGKVFTDTFEKATKEIYEQTQAGTQSIGVLAKMKIAAMAFGAALKVALGPMAIIGMLVTQFKKYKEKVEEARRVMSQISDDTKQFGANLGVSQSVAVKLYGTAKSIGDTMGMTRAQSTGAAKEIYGALGGVESLSDKTMQNFMKLSVHGGVAAETLKQMHTFAKLTGEDAGDVAQNVAKTAQEQIKGLKLNVSMKEIMKSVAGVSNNVKLSFGGSAKAITEAVTKAKKLGLEMKDVESIASSLLNIEDSLAAEMEAELLTGKELNLEKARAAALNGDQVGLMEALSEQGISQADYANMNVIQQEALAKSLGMNRDQMADMLVTQKENTAENLDQVDLQKQGIEAMTTMASLADQLTKMEEERALQAANGVDALTEQDLAMQRLSAALMPLMDLVFIPMMNAITFITTKIAETIEYFTKGKGQLDGWNIAITSIVAAMLAIRTYQIAINAKKKIQVGLENASDLLNKGKVALQNTQLANYAKEAGHLVKNGAIAAGQFLKSVGIAVMKVISSLASIPVVGWGLGLAAAAAVGTMAYKYMNDGVQGPVSGGGGYSRTMYGPEGAIKFNDKDTIVAGTNLGGGGGNDGTVAELQRISGLLNQLLNKEGGVYIDGNKVGATIALTNYQQQ